MAITEMRRKFAEMTQRRDDLEGELTTVKLDLNKAQKALSAAYLSGEKLNGHEKRISQLQARELAIMGALDKANTMIEEANEDLRNAEIGAARGKMERIYKHQDKEAVNILRKAYDLFDECQELRKEAYEGRNLANRDRRNLSSYKINQAAVVHEIIGSDLRAALVKIEQACKPYHKRSKHPRVSRGFEK